MGDSAVLDDGVGRACGLTVSGFGVVFADCLFDWELLEVDFTLLLAGIGVVRGKVGSLTE